jgi:hypothetical protein
MSTTTDELSKRARFLRNAAPQAYQEFHAAFAAYAGDATKILVETTENFQLYQGHAQQLRKLLLILDGAKNG